MKKRSALIFALLLICVCILALYIYYQPEFIHIELYGAAITEDGRVIPDGKLTVSGIHLYPLRYGNSSIGEFYAFQILLPGCESKIESEKLPASGKRHALRNIDGMLIDASGDMSIFKMYIGKDLDWCVVSVEDGRFYVGSAEEAFDPFAILENTNGYFH